MITLLLHLLRLFPFLFGSHCQLAVENLALRQQLAVYKRTTARPGLHRHQGTPPVLLSFFLATARKPDGLRIPVALPPTRLAVLPVDLKMLPSESDEVFAKDRMLGWIVRSVTRVQVEQP